MQIYVRFELTMSWRRSISPMAKALMRGASQRIANSTTTGSTSNRIHIRLKSLEPRSASQLRNSISSKYVSNTTHNLKHLRLRFRKDPLRLMSSSPLRLSGVGLQWSFGMITAGAYTGEDGRICLMFVS